MKIELSDKWKTREAWEIERRTPYHDLFDNLKVDDNVSTYASTAEVEEIITALKAKYKAEFYKLKHPDISILEWEEESRSAGKQNRKDLRGGWSHLSWHARQWI